MEWLNYHHLHYFWVVAREGSIAKACPILRLAQPTISGQLRELENALGEKLFQRSGRNLVLTDVGNVVYSYAEEIFSIGAELKETIRGGGTRKRLTVGITDVLPKLVAYRLLEPVKKLAEPVSLVCHEGSPEDLCAELALHKLDVVLSDTPVTPTVRVKAYNHLLGESTISFFGSPELANRFRRGFPRSLHKAPLLLPSAESSSRSALERWFEQLSIRPAIVGEFADTALMTIFAEEGEGVFPAPSIVAADLKKKSGLQVIGTATDIVDRFYAISVEKRLKHPAVVSISTMARKSLFR